jgi:prophage maintenance system killer protein
MENKIEIYKTTDDQTEIQVQFDSDTVWLNRQQMAQLFDRDRTVISRHISNVFHEHELDKQLVCAKFAHTTPHGAIKGKEQKSETEYYSLDVIISVGYRVKSQRGTQFRQWATQRLKEYLVQGYSINTKRLEQKQQEVEYLKAGIRIVSRAIEEAADDKNRAVFQLFANGLSLLDDYDHETLDTSGITQKEVAYPSYDDYMQLIDTMYSQFESDVFAKMKDDSFDSSINQIRQCFDGKDLYPTIEDKAANLLYFITKNHSFVDGNKRIAAACFLYFLEQNNSLLNSDNTPIIDNATLAALTLFVATSKTEEKEIVKKLIISILNRNKQ